ncbi:MAG: hypothetical protein Q9221_001087 [Calogaya cf. arnoldii]
MEEIVLANLKNTTTGPLYRRIIAQCNPNDPESAAILSEPHPRSTLDARLLKAIAPQKEHDVGLNAFELMLAAQYEEAYNILVRDGVDNVNLSHLSHLHFISQPMSTFKTPF